MWICIANTPLMRYRYSYTSALIVHQPDTDTSLHCKTTDTRLCITCLLTSSAFAGYSYRLPTEGWLRLCACAEVVYPSKDGHPPRH